MIMCIRRSDFNCTYYIGHTYIWSHIVQICRGSVDQQARQSQVANVSTSTNESECQSLMGSFNVSHELYRSIDYCYSVTYPNILIYMQIHVTRYNSTCPKLFLIIVISFLCLLCIYSRSIWFRDTSVTITKTIWC